ncbi:hypothetical protein [Streptomyces cinereoruber]|uniref:hypothetical protein n=1 Tax=Streptomyces cinereoruber TaxID=67260 RepID=UPI0012668F6B|nr:hypothetical protein [Streptomyces cinereoruber]MBB4161624.1 hypothetical protein [Streptomyces cinereoruber]MBY8820411.1 hypothetical protein [Streptomyces cinereoruber]NIH65523.1 hypothetical protein [Streptomyces cinereoruber]
MVWKEPSEAEQRLCEQLAAHGLSVSWAKIRRWREFGALPWKKREGLGRGAGSSSGLLPETFAVAQALALATAKKRPLEQAVLEVFTTGARLDQVLAAATVPLPERAVRRALAWYMARDRSHPFAAIEMAARSAGGCPDKAMDAALEAAHRYFPKLYRQAKQKGRPPGMTVPDSLADADGLATIAVATVLGFEVFGADAVVEAVNQSLPELTDEYGDQVFAQLSSSLRGAEGHGANPWSRRARWPSLQDRIQRVEEVEYAQLCGIRDALALLVEASPALALARRAGVEDPAVRHVEAVRAANRRTDEYLRRAEDISRCPTERAWKDFTGLLLNVCISPRRLSTFQDDVTALDPALNDIPGLGRRVLASCIAASAGEA